MSAADAAGADDAPKTRRLGCLVSWWGLALLAFVPFLIARAAIEAGGILAWWGGILETARESVAAGGAVPGQGAIVLLVGLAIAVVIIVVQSIIYAAVAAVFAPLVAVIQSLLFGVTMRGVLDLFTLRGATIPPEDPRYLQRWRARGALAAVLFGAWVAVLVPLLSRLGPRPQPFPMASQTISLFAWSCVVLMPLFWLLGVVVRAIKRRKSGKTST